MSGSQRSYKEKDLTTQYTTYGQKKPKYKYEVGGVCRQNGRRMSSKERGSEEEEERKNELEMAQEGH